MSEQPKTAEERVRDIFDYPHGPLEECDMGGCADLMVRLMEEHAAAAVAQITRERDEARAELARLHAALDDVAICGVPFAREAVATVRDLAVEAAQLETPEHRPGAAERMAVKESRPGVDPGSGDATALDAVDGGGTAPTEAAAAAVAAERTKWQAAMLDCYMRLPVVPGDALAWVDSNLEQHVTRVADEYAILQRQREAAETAVAQLTRERDEARTENAGLRALLERCEWAECSLRGSIAHDAAMDLCPICGGADPEMVDEESAVAALPRGNPNYDEGAIAKLLTKRGHRPDCALAQALGRDGS